jgi:hypothetical protein
MCSELDLGYERVAIRIIAACSGEFSHRNYLIVATIIATIGGKPIIHRGFHVGRSPRVAFQVARYPRRSSMRLGRNESVSGKCDSVFPRV